MLDKYVIGECERICPEAPVPVVKVKEIKYNAGGAGNAAVNIKTLGSEPFLIGILGDDKEGQMFIEELKKQNLSCDGILLSKRTKTIVKERIVSMNQQLLRIDHEDKEHDDEIANNKEHQEHILNKLKVSDAEIVIVSDYAKATLSNETIEKIIKFCKEKNKIVIIDPRPQHAISYKNASFITPNIQEACIMAKIRIEPSKVSLNNAKNLVEELYKKLNSKIVLTLSEKGILFYEGNESFHLPIFKRELRDVSGAGDTVVAALAVALANNLEIKKAINFANHAAGVKVEKTGVQPVYLKEVIEDIKFHNNLNT